MNNKSTSADITRKDIPIWQILCVIVFAIALLLYTLTQVDGATTHGALIVSAVVAAAVAMYNGYSWSYIERSIINNIRDIMKAVFILIIVGMIISTWIHAGIIQTMIYYGLVILNPQIFFVTAFLLCASMSLATGTSWGTVGTLGVALIGIAMGMGVSLPITAGAAVSGAYFGDKLSPLSDSTHLNAAVSGVDVYEHIKHMLWVTVPATIISLILFAVLGATGAGNGSDAAGVTQYYFMRAFTDNYFISPILLLGPVLIVVLIILKIPPIPGLIAGVFIGIIFGAIFQTGAGFAGYNALEQIGAALYGGYDPARIVAAISAAEAAGADEEVIYALDTVRRLLTRGGILRMWYAISVVMCAMAFGGVLESTNMLVTLTKKIVSMTKSAGSLVLTTSISAIFINITAADQYMSLLLGAKMFRRAYEDKKIHNKNLARVLENSGTMTSAMVPWNTCGAFMAAALGVSVLEYTPYFFLGLIGVPIVIIYGYMGITMPKLNDEEYAEILRKREQDELDAAGAAGTV